MGEIVTDLRCFVREGRSSVTVAAEQWLNRMAAKFATSPERVGKLVRATSPNFVAGLLDRAAFQTAYAHRAGPDSRRYQAPPAPEPPRLPAHETYWRKEHRS